MTRLISIMDAKKRDAQVAVEAPARGARVRQLAPDGKLATTERLIRTIDTTTYEALLRQFGTAAAISDAVAKGDPEIALEQVGRKLDDASRVYIRQDGSMLYSARVLQVVYEASGAEKNRQEFVDVEATVGEELSPVLWSGRLMPTEDVVRKFAFVRKVQLRHVNGLTFDFLFEMAKLLQQENKLVYVGAGPKGQSPLIFNVNGTPYRGFLEGAVSGEKYKLVLHLSNLEIKSTTAGA